jgi:hypothetical protein
MTSAEIAIATSAVVEMQGAARLEGRRRSNFGAMPGMRLLTLILTLAPTEPDEEVRIACQRAIFLADEWIFQWVGLARLS